MSEIKRLQQENKTVKHALGERVKELNCMYSLSKLIDENPLSPDKVFNGLIKLIPSSWQYP